MSRMKNWIKSILRPFVPKALLNKRNISYERWEEIGCPIPPPDVVKQKIIGDICKSYGYKILVETGTYLGDMVEAQKGNFNKVISIELGMTLFKKAKRRFNNDNNVLILHGDSGNLLPSVVKDIKEPAIFWLDGHYSGGTTAKGEKECPIFEELNAILNDGIYNHIILIDDSRCFTGYGDYPEIKYLIDYIKSKNPKYKIEVKHDIIRCFV